jgi:hypothetical protein
MEKAIRKSIEGGWEPPKDYAFIDSRTWTNKAEISGGEILLDPLFWSCLGKALGWGQEPIAYKEPGHFPVREYLMFWHQFIDRIDEGKDAESFFNELLK